MNDFKGVILYNWRILAIALDLFLSYSSKIEFCQIPYIFLKKYDLPQQSLLFTLSFDREYLLPTCLCKLICFSYVFLDTIIWNQIQLYE